MRREEPTSAKKEGRARAHVRRVGRAARERRTDFGGLLELRGVQRALARAVAVRILPAAPPARGVWRILDGGHDHERRGHGADKHENALRAAACERLEPRSRARHRPLGWAVHVPRREKGERADR
eukprot:6831286-Prymnesium_polylepis.1